MGRRPVRIANFSGYLGDRYEALDEVMSGDPVDVLVGDYLAEITLAMLGARVAATQRPGWAEYFVHQVRPHLAALAGTGVRLVTNAGGFDPAGLARTLRRVAGEAGVSLHVAHVDGDNVMGRLADLEAAGETFDHLDTGAPLSSWGQAPATANAYLGGWGIAEALAAGADIVVCGRVTDASLVLGPAAWWHGWDRTDWSALAGAVVAGHVIECGPQATGGNFSGFADVPGVEHAGFPVAEVAADGSSVITKHAAHGGAVTVDTVTAQLLYEIQGPRYLNPDVTVHLDSVRVHRAGPDRVAVDVVAGSPPPATTKVAMFAQTGWQIVQTVFVTAPDVEAKVGLLRRQVEDIGGGDVEVTVTQLGQTPHDPADQWEATVPVRVMATAREREALAPRRFALRVTALYLSSFPGFFDDGGAARVTEPQPRVDYWPAVLRTDRLDHRVTLGDGRVVVVPPAGVTQEVAQPIDPDPVDPAPLTVPGPWVSRPLGDVAFARSGDKGGNSNVGVWVRDPAAWPWLRETLSTRCLRELLPEVRRLEISRHEFPHLGAVHFVLRGLLGTGGSSNTRVDQVGKAVGEYLRAKHLPIPSELLGAPAASREP